VDTAGAFSVKKRGGCGCRRGRKFRQLWQSLECSGNISQPHATTGINIGCKEKPSNFGPVARQKQPPIVAETTKNVTWKQST
jgi:hypothetical protein